MTLSVGLGQTDHQLMLHKLQLRVNEEVKKVTGGFSDIQDTSEDHLMAIFMDITIAYPRVNRNILWHILRKLGMRERMLKNLKNLHEKALYKGKGRNAMSESWVPQRGLREGCAKSPILLSIFHACDMKKANEERRKNADKKNCDCEYHGPGSLVFLFHQSHRPKQCRAQKMKE